MSAWNLRYSLQFLLEHCHSRHDFSYANNPILTIYLYYNFILLYLYNLIGWVGKLCAWLSALNELEKLNVSSHSDINFCILPTPASVFLPPRRGIPRTPKEKWPKLQYFLGISHNSFIVGILIRQKIHVRKTKKRNKLFHTLSYVTWIFHEDTCYSG